jgi:hypothetical protein
MALQYAIRPSVIVFVSLLMVGCGHRVSTDVDVPAGGSVATARATSATPLGEIALTQDDISDRTYRVLGDIEVTVSKWGLFDKDPTPAMVDEALKAEAAKMGADAVVLVRYGTVGIGAFTWGKLEGRGRAVAFVD